MEVFKCVQREAAKFKICTEDMIETNILFFRSIFENAVNLVCGDYSLEQSDKCEHFKMIKLDDTNDKHQQYLNGTFFTPLIKLLANI